MPDQEAYREELRSVIAIVRHGDRTPKQKMKIKVTHPLYLEYYHEYAKSPYKELKVKSKSALVKFLEITRSIVESAAQRKLNGEKLSEEDQYLNRKLNTIKDVLERWEISGINRKLQMKPQKWIELEPEELRKGILVGKGATSLLGESSVVSRTDACADGGQTSLLFAPVPLHMQDAAAGTAVNPTPTVSGTPPLHLPRASEVLLVLKWGGDLTPLGREQAEMMGTEFRHQMYPDPSGGGVLRLHATYRHDLKINASDEGRVMKTAAAFARGLLELEGQLTPILVSLVTVEEKSRQMLDAGGNCEIKEEMDRCKNHLNLLQETPESVVLDKNGTAIVAKEVVVMEVVNQEKVANLNLLYVSALYIRNSIRLKRRDTHTDDHTPLHISQTHSHIYDYLLCRNSQTQSQIQMHCLHTFLHRSRRRASHQ